MRQSKIRNGHPISKGFTLIEILFSLAIFVLGFSAVMMVIPAGQIFQKQAQSGIAGGIYARNGVEILKAQGLHDLATQLMMTGRAMDPQPVSIMATRIAPRFVAAMRAGGQAYSPSDYSSRRTNWDMEGCVYCWQTTINRAMDLNGDQWFPKQISGIYDLRPYMRFNPNNSALWKRVKGVDPQPKAVYDQGYQDNLAVAYHNVPENTTNLAQGKIHFLKNRPVPGVTPGCLSPLDFSFPSSAWDLSSRTVMVHPLFWNATRAYETSPDASIQEVKAPDWRVGCAALGVSSDAQWPELGDGNTGTAGYLLANDADFMRSVATNPVFGTAWRIYRIHEDPGQPEWYETYGFSIGYPATGGDPANTNLSLRAGGLGGAAQRSLQDADEPTGRGRLVPMSAANQGWAGPFMTNRTYNYFPRSHVGAPIRDPSVTSAYQGYVIPPLVRAYALVYDYDQDKILLRYPKAYAATRNGDRADTFAGVRLNEFWSAYPQADPRQGNWKDRKLQVGDWFLGSPGGTLFQVKSVFPIAEEQAYARSVIGEASLDWSDGTYQVVSVTPKLSDTKYTPNKPSILAMKANTEKDDPPLYQALVAPPPITGGNSPWQGYSELPANGTVFRNADDFAN